MRGLYFIRRLYRAFKKTEIDSTTDLESINASELLPFNNRIIKRMITIASGTFTAIDVVDSAVRAAIKNKGVNPAFLVDFSVGINIVGIGRFIIACKTDGQFITEDIQAAKRQRDYRDRIEKEYEKTISDLKVLSLNYNQVRILNSLKRIILEDDINLTNKENEKKLKTEWMNKWSETLASGYQLMSGFTDSFFLTEREIIRYIRKNGNGPWLHLVSMEVMRFTPYYAIFEDEEADRRLKDLKCRSKYLVDKFTALQDKINRDDILKLQKAYKRAAGIVTGSTKNAVIGAVGTTVAIAATGGLAFAFAPAIATALVGEAASGLYGAALVSYSLAAIGGGSLAAGGLGMAGGTAIITGGGALVGMLGGTGISAATTINLLADDGYVLCECCKLIAFSKEVLLEKYNNAFEVSEIQAKVASRINDVQKQIESFSKHAECEKNVNKKREMKAKIKVAKKSTKYLERTRDELEKLMNTKKAN